RGGVLTGGDGAGGGPPRLDAAPMWVRSPPCLRPWRRRRRTAVRELVVSSLILPRGCAVHAHSATSAVAADAARRRTRVHAQMAVEHLLVDAARRQARRPLAVHFPDSLIEQVGL